MKIALVAALLLTGCGARTELYAPPVDEVLPGHVPEYCKDLPVPSVFVTTLQNEIYQFDPPKKSFTLVGTINCPLQSAGQTPFSMAVDHEGTAYMVFGDGELFLVDTATGVCTATSSPIDTSAFTPTFGMGFTADPGGATETLYLASTTNALGTLDTTTFVVTPIAPFSEDFGEAELTGTGDGRLFAFGEDTTTANPNLAEIDKTDASVESVTPVAAPNNPQGWAFSFWGGNFYFFTTADGVTSTVGQYDPATGVYDPVYATLATAAIDGAGVSTCAPR